MTGPYVVGVDVGTTSAKAVVVDDAWRVRGEAREEYPTRYLPGNGAEQNPDDWWGASARCIAAALEQAGVAAPDVAAVGVSSQAPSVVLLDGDGRPLGPALLWMDRRGQAECALRTAEGARVVALTGNRLDPYYAAPKLAWLLRTDPSLARRASTFLMANGYVTHRLTGVVTADTGHAGLSLLNDLDADGWSGELAELWGVPPTWLPPLSDPSTVVGMVSPAAAPATGLAAGTPVIAGLVDGVAASLESGVVAHGDVCEMTGQSTVVNAAVKADVARQTTGALSVMPYPVPGHHLVFGSMVATGGILRWFRDEFGSGLEDGDFAALDALAGTASPGSGGLLMLPYFLGERSPIWDSDARGAVVGLSMSTTRADLVRAILEGTAYGLAHNVAELAAMGLKPAALRIVGGGARGRTWNQIKADVTGLPVELPSHSLGAPVGTALVAAAGVGLVADLVEVVRRRYAVTERIAPDPSRHADYQRRYRIYRDLYPALRDVHRSLAELR
ncbi:MAG: xylulokinase [Micromonosporaceae bacterium]